ncbi:MAG TPA: S26 family signal peptidase [Gaiellaceae bacterium]|jgi:signal peptidase I|nr:S26 family signal peptidase [Gaiellaceae bacterium]
MRRLRPLGIALVVIVAVLVVAGVAGFFAVAKAYRVPGDAMSPSLRAGDRILVLRFGGPVDPDQGDIVAYRASGARCGFPGTVVFVHRVARVMRGGRFVVRGDNPARSCDSRVLGPVRRKDLIGQVVAVYWPPRHWGLR